jgi:hypothetical protein
MEGKQFIAVFGFLGFAATLLTLAATFASIVAIRLAGEERLAQLAGRTSAWLFGGRGLARKLAIAALILVAGYGTTLLGASVASREHVLPVTEEKYFCEIDCHLAYSVEGVEKKKILAAHPQEPSAAGDFFVVSVRTRFDEHTISPHRGDSPLAPPTRDVTIVDDQGHRYPISAPGQQALENLLGNRWTSPTTPLRPGESYVTQFVFDLSSNASGLKLLIASPRSRSWIGRVVIGDEDSIFHKKVYLQLPGR